MPFDRDDDEYYDENEYTSAPPPPIRVTAHLKGGPADGETRELPWARIKLPVLTWDGDTPTESVYQMGERWLHQRDVDYVLVEPPVERVQPVYDVSYLAGPPHRPRARRAQLALRAARDAWRRAA